jgi:antitoxin (DNA-binding transcriptional repressor) of toxin-antitoxin stability system
MPLRLDYTAGMKTATIQQVPQQWPQILDWLACDEEVQVTRNDRIIARIVPALSVPAPDFLARAKAVWGTAPAGQPLSTIVDEARGGDS